MRLEGGQAEALGNFGLGQAAGIVQPGPHASPCSTRHPGWTQRPPTISALASAIIFHGMIFLSLAERNFHELKNLSSGFDAAAHQFDMRLQQEGLACGQTQNAPGYPDALGITAAILGGLSLGLLHQPGLQHHDDQ